MTMVLAKFDRRCSSEYVAIVGERGLWTDLDKPPVYDERSKIHQIGDLPIIVAFSGACMEDPRDIVDLWWSERPESADQSVRAIGRDLWTHLKRRHRLSFELHGRAIPTRLTEKVKAENVTLDMLMAGFDQADEQLVVLNGELYRDGALVDDDPICTSDLGAAGISGVGGYPEQDRMLSHVEQTILAGEPSSSLRLLEEIFEDALEAQDRRVEPPFDHVVLRPKGVEWLQNANDVKLRSPYGSRHHAAFRGAIDQNSNLTTHTRFPQTVTGNVDGSLSNFNAGSMTQTNARYPLTNLALVVQCAVKKTSASNPFEIIVGDTTNGFGIRFNAAGNVVFTRYISGAASTPAATNSGGFTATNDTNLHWYRLVVDVVNQLVEIEVDAQWQILEGPTFPTGWTVGAALNVPISIIAGATTDEVTDLIIRPRDSFFAASQPYFNAVNALGVGGSALNANVVDAQAIAAGAVGTSEIAANAVTNAKMGAGAAAANIGTGGVSTTMIAAGAVTAAKIAFLTNLLGTALGPGAQLVVDNFTAGAGTHTFTFSNPFTGRSTYFAAVYDITALAWATLTAITASTVVCNTTSGHVYVIFAIGS